jgi:outer membrane protein assembly factor BamB
MKRLVVLCVISLVATVQAGDWYQWRGPEQNGVSREKGLPESWSPEGENLVWSNDCGGMSSPIVMNGKVYTYTRVGEVPAGEGFTATSDPGPKTQEAFTCIDARTGKIIWRDLENMTMTDVPFHRVGWSNPVGDPKTGRVYGLGAQCMLQCFEGDSGKIVWQRQMTEEFGMISTFGGRTPSPAIDDDILYIAGVSFGWGDHAGGQHRIFAFDKSTGQLLWSNGTGGVPVDAPYNTPVIAVINGEKQVVFAAGDGGIHSFQARTGVKAWSFKGSKRGMSSSVIVDGNLVYATWDLDNFDSTKLGRVVCLDGASIKDGSPKEVWRLDGVEAGFPTGTIYDGVLYIPTNIGQIFAIDAKTGKLKYKQGFGTIGKASLVFADGKLYYPEANGRMCILRPGPKKFEVVHKVELEEKLGREYVIFGSVAIANGQIFLQAANKMYCIGPKEPKVESDPIPEPVKEEPVATRSAPSVVQVVPADVVLRPGETAKFSVRVFDGNGRPMPGIAGSMQWSIGQLTMPPPRARPAALLRTDSMSGANPTAPPPPAPTPAPAPTTAPASQPTKAGNLEGAVDASGVFTAAAGPLQGGAVIAKVGAIEGQARVRVLPPLPWKFDFTDTPPGKPPFTWIGAGMKFASRELDGQNVLVKLTDIPLYARARTYFGTPEQSGYTIQADVRVTEMVIEEQGRPVRQMPDVGVINTRYVLELKGSKQTLGIHSWPAALPRDERAPGLATHAAILFPWKANTWYRQKLAVERSGDKTIAKGKVWEANQPEPSDWTITMEDPTPNATGAPGLWGFSNFQEIYYDNVVVSETKP